MQAGGDFMSQSFIEGVEFFTPAILSSPLPLLAELRDSAPVCSVRQNQFDRDVFLVSNYELVKHALCVNLVPYTPCLG